MRLDHIAIALRSRESWEAVDLGAVMLRAWWRPIFSAWFAIVLPLALALHVPFTGSPWIALILLWWLKPLYDRVVLFVLSRAVFGAAPDTRATLRGLGALIRSSGLLGALTWRRFDPARSFNLAVRQLELQSGAPARARERLLGRRAAGQATGLLYACLMFEVILVLSLNLCIDLVTPAGIQTNETFDSFFVALLGINDTGWTAYLRNLFYFLAICVVEPLFVASGFALYLNRRTALEAWDIELAFRGMQRDSKRPAQSLAALVIGSALACVVLPPPQYAWATDTAADSRRIIREVLAAPDFREYEEKAVWRSREGARETNERRSRPAFLDILASIADALAQLSRVAAYGLIAVVVVVLVLYLLRSATGWSRLGRSRDPAAPRPLPQTLFGLDVRPETLPDNLAEIASQAAVRDPRMALSLLYRGALATLIHRDRLRIEAGDTEGDCMRRVRSGQQADVAAYFARLVAAWSQVAYAGRTVETASVQALCRDWPRFFARIAEGLK